MKKIDFHIHTVATNSDSAFTFSIDKLKEYVDVRQLDCIAITNHNTFDLGQFRLIKSRIAATVLPGIEIDLEGGQLLLIGDGIDIEDFAGKCQKISGKDPTKKNSITVEQLKEVFQDLSKYILIPHYEKKPKISDATLAKISSFVTAGEVTSPKKFMYCQNSEDKLVPLYFSDCRMRAELKEFPVRQTYIDCEEASFAALKSCLRDKHKVALSEREGNSTFQIFDSQKLSTGLNVILGGRSSGKTHTLRRISENFKNVKYLKQFSLVESDEKEDEKKFDTFLSQGRSLHSDDYLKELKAVVNDVISVDLVADDRAVVKYLDSLLRHAKETEKRDAFSSAKLFNEEEFQILSQKGLKELIESAHHLMVNGEFKKTIEEHVSLEGLKDLYVALMLEYSKRELKILKEKWLNALLREIKTNLQMRSAVPPVSEIDLYKIALDLNKVEKFSRVVHSARKEREIQRTQEHGFEIVASVGEFKGAMELKNVRRLKTAFSDAYKKYDEPYEYLQELRNVSGLEEADFYRYFVKIDYNILNKDGFPVSGGERSEFNLLQQIQDAQSYDMLLIDEPESSFDNVFLNSEVNKIIKDISKTMPVILVTHNSTVGASIKPDYLLHTKKEIVGGKVGYQIYSGAPSSKELISSTGERVNTLEVTMGCLEAGETAYNQRRQGYEDLKN